MAELSDEDRRRILQSAAHEHVKGAEDQVPRRADPMLYSIVGGSLSGFWLKVEDEILTICKDEDPIEETPVVGGGCALGSGKV
jgi:hypothetical protein